MVAMWCKTECFTGVSFGTGEMSEGNSWSRAVNSSSPTGRGKLGLGETTAVNTLLTWRWVMESMRRPLLTSMSRLK